MTKPTRDKAHFDDWFGEAIGDLNLREGYESYTTENIEKVYWKKIWEVYDKMQATPMDEYGQEYATDELKSIILEAHGKDESDHLQAELMEHYMNSGNYD
ncbi:hypothetical protein OGM63_12315 [Plectonema radiosum NIES-515]|uniref:Uncharacterized protein n=1 Tax=Plectonema radiosum NIES-515 TaxID=2986073 RepID=A0ABT3AYT2_9CYAN|nr:hypothetical protein [Plectonema radiosum]MCV3214287.1 hypothetical protein [Plectonema radiosum NIES-515]